MIRLVVACFATPVDLLPTGNTGGARVSPWRAMPIEPDAKCLLRSDPRSARGLEKSDNEFINSNLPSRSTQRAGGDDPGNESCGVHDDRAGSSS
jgi:hypothetical protein